MCNVDFSLNTGIIIRLMISNFNNSNNIYLNVIIQSSLIELKVFYSMIILHSFITLLTQCNNFFYIYDVLA